MEATLKSPSPAVAEAPKEDPIQVLWEKYLNGWSQSLRSYDTSLSRRVKEGYGRCYAEYTACACCGAPFLRKDGTMWGHGTLFATTYGPAINNPTMYNGWREGRGIYLGANQDAETLKKHIMQEGEFHSLELKDEDHLTIIWKDL